MVLYGQLPVGFLDLVLGGCLGDTQDLVEVSSKGLEMTKQTLNELGLDEASTVVRVKIKYF